MKPCRNTPHRAAEARSTRAGGTSVPVSAGTSPAGTVNRYCHPIQVRGAAHSGGTEELLSYILEALSHQADLLEELLRRTGGEDTR